MIKKRPADADKLLERLAVSSPNDAVKLLYLGAEDISELEGLDLSLLSEIKRGPKGEVELKFVNKLAIIRELIELNAAAAAQQAQGGGFYAALDNSARLLEGEKSNDDCHFLADPAEGSVVVERRIPLPRSRRRDLRRRGALGQDPVHGHILCLLGHAPV